MAFSKYLDPKNDFCFKKVFGTEKHKNILIHFINDMLGFVGDKQIKEVTFLKTSQDPDVAAKKQSSVDVLCTDEIGRQYIVEMQVAKKAGFEKRAQYYAAKAYVSQMNEGGLYTNLKEIIFLAITNFLMFPGSYNYKTDHITLNKVTHEHQLKDFYFSFLELPKFNKEIEQLETIVDKWAYFFKHAAETSVEELDRLAGKDIIIKQAYNAVDQFYWDEVERNTYEQYKKNELDAIAIEQAKQEEWEAKIAQGKSEGRAEGINEGRLEGIKVVARELLLDGMPIEKISYLTGLPEHTIKELASN